MAVVAAYFDESKDGKGTLAIAGYVAPVWTWDGITPRWQSLLSNCGPRPAKEFKASDCRSGFGEFAGWSPEERLLLTTQLVDLIVEGGDYTGMFGVGAGVYGHLNSEIDPDLEPIYYLSCFRKVVQHVFRCCDFLEAEDSIQFVFDEKDDVAFRAIQAFGRVVDEERGLFRAKVLEPQFARSHELAPLQAADLLAYETFKEMKNRFHGEEQLPVSVALHRLVSERYHVALVSTHWGLISDAFIAQSRADEDGLSEALGNVISTTHHGVLYVSGLDVRPPRPVMAPGSRKRMVMRWFLRWAIVLRSRFSRKRYKATSE